MARLTSLWLTVALSACVHRPLYMPELSDGGAAPPDGAPTDVPPPADGARCQVGLQSGGSATWPMMTVGATVGDFNGDGHLDYALADYGTWLYSQIGSLSEPGGLALFLGRGDGSFEDPRRVELRARPMRVLSGDFDEDGIDDLVVYEEPTNDRGFVNGAPFLELWRGGRNGAMTVTPIDVAPHAQLAAGYVDRDRHLDLIVSTDGGYVLLLGRGDGTFTNVGRSGIAAIGELWIDDFNGDGNSDLASTDPLGIRVQLGSGGGSFSLPTSTPRADDSRALIFGVKSGDVDGDGRVDLVTIGERSSLFRGRGDGTFDPGVELPFGEVTSFDVVDLDGDGRAEVVVPVGGALVLTRANDGSFSARRWASPHGLRVATGDWDEDGKSELLLVGESTVERVLLDGAGALRGDGFTGGGDSNVVFVDPRSDGAELIFINTRGFGVTRRHLGRDGSVGPLRTSTPLPSAGSACVGDFDGDGRLDLVVTHSDQQWRTLDGASQTVSPFPRPSSASVCVGGADLDGDGRADLVVEDESGAVSWMRALGGGTFASPTPTGITARFLPELLDADGDGRVDLVWLDPNASDLAHGNHLEVARGLGQGAFATAAPSVAGSLGPAWNDAPHEVAAAGDVDGDGRRDLVVIDAQHRALQLLRGQAGGAFAAPIDIPLGAAPSAVSIADLDGDGALDLVASLASGLAWLRGNGDGSFVAPSLVAIPGDISGHLKVVDLDGDGRPEVIGIGRHTNQVTVLRNVCE